WNGSGVELGSGESSEPRADLAAAIHRLKSHVPPRVAPGSWPAARHPRRMIALGGCVQPGAMPQINAAAARVLDRLGVSLIEAPGARCCGAVRYHLNRQADGLDDMRRTIDAWWPLIEDGCEAIVMTASGCGATVREYGHLLHDDPDYAEKAAQVSTLCRDLSEVISELDLGPLATETRTGRVAFHPPCTLQHAQKKTDLVEPILAEVGYTLTRVPDKHLCCGSAGTYSMLQPDFSNAFKQDKVAALLSDAPSVIASANIGCLMHIQSGTDVPVKHWIELLDR
ncbi:MAG: glycolate oxidase subunit GlcF, partial [Pseudomonadota bacterium]